VAPPSLGPPSAVRFDDGVGTIIWELPAAHDGAATFDVRLLEGSAGAVSVRRTTQRSLPAPDLDLTFASPRRAYRSTGAIPVSRLATCTSTDAQSSQPVTRAPCELTDGRFAEREPSLAGPVVIDLGREVAASLVALRGCDSECTVEAAGADSSFTPLVTATAPFTAFVPPGRPMIRFVRVEATDGFTEVSVWDDEPNGTFELVSPTALAEAATADIPSVLRPKGSDGPSTVLVVVAVLLAAGVLVAIGMAVGRRRASV
jgi:hypothetical protein